MAENKTEDLVVEKIWMDDPESHDYDAAADYLDLHFCQEKVKVLVKDLKEAKTVFKKAKDILRASNLPLLDETNEHVKHNLKKFKKGTLLSPVLLIRNSDRLIIADGYHRISAAHIISEDLVVPCRLV